MQQIPKPPNYCDEPSFVAKYKPVVLNDFFFDDRTKRTLTMLRDMDELNVLFIGNSNAGKTSLLGAMIREYYGPDSAVPVPHQNIMHVNNLKEQGIHFFRNEMHAFCKSQTCILGRKKMIVIDDMDFVNQQNQQVFCNYMDKYKNNVCFIMACTNKQKIIENIQSRAHIVAILPPPREYLEKFMHSVISRESIRLTNDARDFIFQISGSSVRCVLKHLEKIKLYQACYYSYDIDETENENENETKNETKNDTEPANSRIVDLAMCKTLCSSLSTDYFETYFAHLREGRIMEAIRILYDICDYGYSVIDILYYFFTFVEATSILGEEEKYKIIIVLCEFITIFHNIHEDIIELALFSRRLLVILCSRNKPAKNGEMN
jgi:DNA polymerase III delta prime subunit